MEEQYLQFQIQTTELNLPNQDTDLVVEVRPVSCREEYQILINLFLKIFPDEIDYEKGEELRDRPIDQLQGEGIYLAFIGSQSPAGFLVTGIINRVGYISYIGVIPTYRSQGVATALLTRFKQYLIKQNVGNIRCKIRKDNRRTLGYIEFLGFRQL